jgi:hypothetical protein
MKLPLAFLPYLISLTVAVANAPWNLDRLPQPPKTYEAPEFATNGVRAIFFDGLPWKGQPTRVFAFIGIPDHKPGEQVSGIALVHGNTEPCCHCGASTALLQIALARRRATG